MKNYFDIDGIRDEALLKSGSEALAIGFPLDGPVLDAMAMCLVRVRHAAEVETLEDDGSPHRYLQYLERVQARYPEAYDRLSKQVSHELTKKSVEIPPIPMALLMEIEQGHSA